MNSATKKILVAVDFSKNSDFALMRAVSVAKRHGSKIILLHVIRPDFLDHAFSHLIPKKILLTPQEYTENLMKQKVTALKKHHLDIQSIIATGNPAPIILKIAKKHKVDLLILGAHGQHSIKDNFLGTTAEYIAKKTQIPAWIVKNPPKKSITPILLPVDFSNSNQYSIHYAAQFFPAAKLKMLHVGNYEYENLLKQEVIKDTMHKSTVSKLKKAILTYLHNQLKKFIKKYEKKLVNVPCKIKLGYPGPVVVEEAKKTNIELIIMTTRGHHNRRHYLFIGSTTNYVLTESEKDILLVPPHKM